MQIAASLIALEKHMQDRQGKVWTEADTQAAMQAAKEHARQVEAVALNLIEKVRG